MTELACIHRGRVVSTTTRPDGTKIPKHRCGLLKVSCTVADHQIPVPGGMMPACVTCQERPIPRIRTFDTLWDRTIVVNLARRSDRLEAFREQTTPDRWPWVTPIVQTGVDGDRVKAPDGFKEGNYAWGCLQSHRHAIEAAINDGCESVLIMEDDALFCDDFAGRAKQFFSAVPTDWEIVWLGGRHHGTPTAVAEGVIRPADLQFMVCYGIRGAALMDLYRHWHSWTTVHCDWVLGPWLQRHRAYCPNPWLVGHTGGWSDITLANKTQSWFEPPTIANSCRHRSPAPIRIGACDLCGLRGQSFEVHHCSKHVMECSEEKKHSEVRSCTLCRAVSEDG